MIPCCCPKCSPGLRDRIIGTLECRAAARIRYLSERLPLREPVDAMFERILVAQEARDRRTEREDIELGWLDLGGEAGA